MFTAFTIYMLKSIIKTLGSKNKYVMYLFIFHEHRNTLVFKVIGKVMYYFIED